MFMAEAAPGPKPKPMFMAEGGPGPKPKPMFMEVSSDTVRARASNPEDMSIEAVRSQVLASEVVQAKIEKLCPNGKPACQDRAKDALFCQLLERSRPELAEQHCSAPKAPALIQRSSETRSSASFAAVKAKVLASKAFQTDAAAMSYSMACHKVHASDACRDYVKQAAFCYALAHTLPSALEITGARTEEANCRTLDKRMPAALLQYSTSNSAPEDDLAKEMTHDLEQNFNKIAPFGKEDTAKELQDHAAKTQDTLVDAVENAEVAEIKRAVFRALTRLRAATIKEFDTIARLETQAIDAYNDAHHYRAENPLAHLHEDEAPVETDKLKSFH